MKKIKRAIAALAIPQRILDDLKHCGFSTDWLIEKIPLANEALKYSIGKVKIPDLPLAQDLLKVLLLQKGGIDRIFGGAVQLSERAKEELMHKLAATLLSVAITANHIDATSKTDPDTLSKELRNLLKKLGDSRSD